MQYIIEYAIDEQVSTFRIEKKSQNNRGQSNATNMYNDTYDNVDM